MIRDFGRKELKPGYKERVKNARIPPEIIKKVADLGLMGLNVPEQYGGDPKDTVTIGVVLEELARWADDGAWLVFNNFALAGIVGLACEEVKQEWLPAIAKGEKIVCMGATEAEAGSDLGNLRTTFKKDGDYFILNGEKNRVTFATQGHAAMILAKADLSSRKITPFLVPFDTPGVSIAPIIDIGCQSLEGGIVSLQDVRIPKKFLLGDEEGKGFQATMRTFDCVALVRLTGISGQSRSRVFRIPWNIARPASSSENPSPNSRVPLSGWLRPLLRSSWANCSVTKSSG